MPNTWPRRRLSNKLRPASTPQLPTKPRSHSRSASSPMVLAKPQPFNGTRGADAKAFVGQIGLHADYAATWSQPYLDKVFNGEPVVFNDFLNDFRSSFFDHHCRYHAKVALWNLSARMDPCWPTCRTSTSMPGGQHPAHEPQGEIHLAVVMSNIEFDSLWG
ncbi:uncharacterized protein VP01_7358g1 [Puccinia sorghi]|uniref:Uncharacterized protein n=1 Tax=Puccinia sorghi TaxID=27349 RepID=A0A0L6UEW7_9BASI|nr:uncharacterized protein VP01_7358g1 [Puccinia sorghi]